MKTYNRESTGIRVSSAAKETIAALTQHYSEHIGIQQSRIDVLDKILKDELADVLSLEGMSTATEAKLRDCKAELSRLV